jgi:hypothetical protein
VFLFVFIFGLAAYFAYRAAALSRALNMKRVTRALPRLSSGNGDERLRWLDEFYENTTLEYGKLRLGEGALLFNATDGWVLLQASELRGAEPQIAHGRYSASYAIALTAQIDGRDGFQRYTVKLPKSELSFAVSDMAYYDALRKLAGELERKYINAQPVRG